eukprot:TRINITY_DN26759_c0_g1_i1.p1 TRINITY_DN26759_c0_g1~~TRINITY_DN26759_c0_g1_i1.p1  ORF type:complete len:258 (+),score=20.96 TRINITY_DN26759_c0_g1_i1:76-774(+)
MPGYLPMANENKTPRVPVEEEKDDDEDEFERPTLSKLPLKDLLNMINQPGMPVSGEVSKNCYTRYGRPQTPPPHGRPVSRVSRISLGEGVLRDSFGSLPNSARPSSGGSRPLSARPLSARGHSSKPDFLVAMPQGKTFSPRVDYLESRVVGNGSQWDQDRLLQPERAFPCIDRGAAEFHDRNELRENRPPWKPTIANRTSGMGTQVGAAFPLPPRPLSSRPRSARGPSPLRV